MLMQTTITVECGQDLATKLTMHEGILRSHSKKLDQLFNKAKSLRENYESSKSICGQLSAIMLPEMTAKKFEENSFEDQVHTKLSAYRNDQSTIHTVRCFRPIYHSPSSSA
jgi:hypothetical protein